MFSRVFSRLKARSATFGAGHQELPLPLKLMLARFLLIIGALLGAIFGVLGSILEPSWGHLGAILGNLGETLDYLGGPSC